MAVASVPIPVLFSPDLEDGRFGSCWLQNLSKCQGFENKYGRCPICSCFTSKSMYCAFFDWIIFWRKKKSHFWPCLLIRLFHHVNRRLMITNTKSTCLQSTMQAIHLYMQPNPKRKPLSKQNLKQEFDTSIWTPFHNASCSAHIFVSKSRILHYLQPNAISVIVPIKLVFAAPNNFQNIWRYWLYRMANFFSRVIKMSCCELVIVYLPFQFVLYPLRVIM